METLTKENFWDEMEQKYPKAIAHFKQWIDQYKSEHDWDKLFNYITVAKLLIDLKGYCKEIPTARFSPKYHELPIAMQFGIFLEYWDSLTDIQLNDYTVEFNIKFEGFLETIKITIDFYLEQLEGNL